MMNQRRIRPLVIAIAALAVAAAGPAFAQSSESVPSSDTALELAVEPAAGPVVPQSSDTVTISDTAVNAVGRIAVNVSAGELNQQVNSAVIGQGDNLVVRNVVIQVLDGNSVSNPGAVGSGSQEADINDGAFSGAQGLISVNGAAGAENQQANLALFGISNSIDTQIKSLTYLSQIRASKEPPGDLGVPASEKTADIHSTAFTDASGLVQVNLTAGERNSSANVFGLTLAGGTN